MEGALAADCPGGVVDRHVGLSQGHHVVCCMVHMYCSLGFNRCSNHHHEGTGGMQVNLWGLGTGAVQICDGRSV